MSLHMLSLSFLNWIVKVRWIASDHEVIRTCSCRMEHVDRWLMLRIEIQYLEKTKVTPSLLVKFVVRLAILAELKYDDISCQIRRMAMR